MYETGKRRPHYIHISVFTLVKRASILTDSNRVEQ